MPYSTIEDIKKMLPEAELLRLTDDEDAGAINTARVDEAIAQADAEIDAYVGARYSVPLAGAPEFIRKASVDLAIYNLHSRTALALPEVRRERYTNTVRLLEGISSGKVTLGMPQQPDPTEIAEGSSTNKSAPDNVFTRRSLRGF